MRWARASALASATPTEPPPSGSRAHATFRARLAQPVDAASLAAFRSLFGLLLLGAIVRSWQKGVIEQAYLAPQFFFRHHGFGFLEPPGQAAYALYALLAALSLAISLGLATRVAAGLFCLIFSYLHFLDLTNYLNHYYLVSLLTGLLAVAPTGRLPGITGRGEAWVPAWVLSLFRFQFGLVYFFGGVAKLKADWLFLGEPLHIWLAANTEVPLLGPLFALPRTGLVMSWLGAAYDLSIPFFLLMRRTRPYAYAAVVFFHVLTARLFQIGMFPYIMMTGSLLFLSPSWPRRFFPRALRAPEPRSVSPLGKLQTGLLTSYVAFQLLTPLRHFLYPGNMLWTEQGYRFAWHVMLIEKTGAAEFRLVDRATGAQRLAFPRTLLTRNQTKAMATQPDMILQLAHELARRERAEGRDVAVYADVFVVLNGRPPRRFIDPSVDLSRVEETLAPKRWVLPGP